MKPSASSLFLATLAISSSSSSLAAPANDGGLADSMPSFPSSQSFNLDDMVSRELRSVELADAIAARGGHIDRRDLISGLIGALDPVFKIVCPIIDPTLRPVLDIVHGLLGVDVCGPKGASMLSAESLIAPLAKLSVDEMSMLESALKTITEQALKQVPVSPPSNPLTPRADKVLAPVDGGGDEPVPGDEVCEDDGPCSDDDDLDAEAAPIPVDKVVDKAPVDKAPVDKVPTEKAPVDPKHPKPPVDPKHPLPVDTPADGKAPTPAAAAPSHSPPVASPSPPSESPSPPRPPQEKPDLKEKVPVQKPDAPIPPPMRRSKASLGWSYHRRDPSESRILENAPPLFSNVPVATRPDFVP